MNKIDAKNKFPSLFLDSKNISDLRKKVQKSFYYDEFFPFMIFRPFSIYISLLIFNKTNISANNITILMSILSFLAPIIIFFINPISTFFLVSFILYFFIYFLDIIDGEIARLREETSLIGKIYDATLWFYLPLLYIIYIYKISLFYNFKYVVVFSLLSIFSNIMSDILQKIFSDYKSANDKKKYYSINIIIIYILRFLFSQSGIFFIAPLFYYLNIGMIYLLIYIYIALFLYLINSFLRFNFLVKQLTT